MSTLKVLKEYLVGDSGYLLNDDNNGKTVMLSGAWGSGKTHFWQNEIVKKQSKIGRRNKYPRDEYKKGLFSILTKKKKACVYISLYGKDNIEDIKSQVFTKAYAQIPKKGNKNKNIDTAIEWLGYGSKIASAVSLFGVKIDTTEITDKAKDYQDNEKLNKAQAAIQNGGVICFDDFERKSKHIDLNDLFGVLTQLSLEFNCKVIIILNSDVFEGKEANVFRTVKEKTVNKFFYFEPTIEELFNSIYESNEKYKKLDNYRDEILKAIKETEELNARIYIQVLDNCWEWVDKEYDDNQFYTGLRELVLCTIFFIKHHLILSYIEKASIRIYDVPNIFLRKGFRNIYHILNSKSLFINHHNRNTTIHLIYENLKEKQENKDYKLSEDLYIKQNETIDTNQELIYDFIKYIYELNADKTKKSLFIKMNEFIKTGILLKKDEKE